MNIFRLTIVLAFGCFLIVQANRRTVEPTATSHILNSQSPRARGVAEKYSIKERLFEPDSRFEYSLFKEANSKDKLKKKIAIQSKDKYIRKDPKIITKPIPGEEYVSFSKLGSVSIPPIPLFRSSQIVKTLDSNRGPKIIEHPALPIPTINYPTFGNIFFSEKEPVFQSKSETSKNDIRNSINLEPRFKDIAKHQQNDVGVISVPPGIFSFKFTPTTNPMRHANIPRQESAKPSYVKDIQNVDLPNSPIDPLQTSETRTRSKIEIKEVNGTLYEYEYIYYYDEEPALYDYDVPIVDDGPAIISSETPPPPAQPLTTSTTTKAPTTTSTARTVPSLLLSRGSRPRLGQNEIIQVGTISDSDNQLREVNQQPSVQASRGRLVPQRGSSRAVNNEAVHRNSLLRPTIMVKNEVSKTQEILDLNANEPTAIISSTVRDRGRGRGRGRGRPAPTQEEPQQAKSLPPSEEIIQTPVRQRGRISLSRSQSKARLAPQPVQPAQRIAISDDLTISKDNQIATSNDLLDIKKDLSNDSGKLPVHTRFPPRTTTPFPVEGVRLNINNSQFLTNIEDDLAALTAEAEKLPSDVLEQELDALFTETTTGTILSETDPPARSAINLYALSRAIDAESETTTELPTTTEAETKPPVDYDIFYDYAYDVPSVKDSIPTWLPEIIETTEVPEPTTLLITTTPKTIITSTTTKVPETTTNRIRSRGRGRGRVGASRFRRPNNIRDTPHTQPEKLEVSTTQKSLIETSTKLNQRISNNRNRANIIRGRTRPNLSRFGSRNHIRPKSEPEKKIEAATVAPALLNVTDVPLSLSETSTTTQPKFRGRFSRPRPNIQAFRARSKKLQQEGATGSTPVLSRGNLFNKIPERKRPNRLHANKEIHEKNEQMEKPEMLDSVTPAEIKNKTVEPEIIVDPISISKQERYKTLSERRQRRPGLGRFSRIPSKNIEKEISLSEVVKPEQVVVSENTTNTLNVKEEITEAPARPSRFGGRSRTRTRNRHRFNTKFQKSDPKPKTNEEDKTKDENVDKPSTLADVVSQSNVEEEKAVTEKEAMPETIKEDVEKVPERRKGRRFFGRNRKIGEGRRQKLSAFLGKQPNSLDSKSTTSLPIIEESTATEKSLDIIDDISPVEEPTPDEVSKSTPEEITPEIKTENLSRRELLALRRRQFLGRS